MKEELKIINASIFNEAKATLETLIGYQKDKLDKFEKKFIDILGVFKSQFSEQTKDIIISYGE